MRVLVTGATGFLGKYIVDEFSNRDCDTIAFGRNGSAGENLKRNNVAFIKGDFTKENDIVNAAKNVDAVIHAGALCEVWGKWSDFYDTNVLGTKNVLDACLKNNISKFVYVSSCSVYNCTYDRLGIKENDFDPANELNYYIKSKIMAEKLIAEYIEKQGLSATIIRPHGIFGIGDVSIVPRLIKANSKIGIPLFNNGKNLIDIVCAENVAHSLWLCANYPGNGIFNITNGEIFQYQEIVDQIFKQIGITPKYVPVKFKTAYAMASALEGIYKLLRLRNEPVVTKYTLTTIGVSQTLDISSAKEQLSYAPQKTLAEGIDSYVKWWRESNSC